MTSVDISTLFWTKIICAIARRISTAKKSCDWHSKLKFRDVLRENTELAREYTDYKLELAKHVSNKSGYAEIKTKWVDSFILKIFSQTIEEKR